MIWSITLSALVTLRPPPNRRRPQLETLGILPLLLGGGSLGTTLRYASLRPRDRRCMNRTFQTIEPMMCSRFRDGDGRFDSYSPSNSGNTIEMPSVIHTIPGVKSDKVLLALAAASAYIVVLKVQSYNWINTIEDQPIKLETSKNSCWVLLKGS